MNRIKFIPISLFFLLIVSDIFCQDAEQNHEKYWYYRHRLINNFMLVGDCQGCSLPAYRRASGTEAGTLDWWDGQDPGWYIGILATEYALLKKNGQDVSETKMELFYALQAINRLDYNMELDWGASSGSYNGCFIRDDVTDYRSNPDDNFVKINYDHFNSSSVQTQVPPVTKSFSIYGGKHFKFGCCMEENSQDNAIYLMMGLALVNKFVDSDAEYNDGSGAKHFSRDGETKILYEARNICKDVVNWIKEGKNGTPYDIPWAVFNAVTGNLVEEGNGMFYTDENGDQHAQCYGCMSYGMAEAACKITNTSDGTHLLYGITCLDYHNVISTTELGFWNTIQTPAVLAASSLGPGSDSQIGVLAAIGNSWYATYPPFLPINNSTAVSLASYFYNTLPAKRQDKEYLPLLRQVLHGGTNLVPDNQYTYLLNSAPCEGPWNFGNGNYAGAPNNDEWSTHNRFRIPEKRGLEPVFPGEYYGLDYMLLFNLYCLVQEDYLSSYWNQMDKVIAIDFPIPNTPVGSQYYPLNITALNTITADNHIKFGGHPALNGDVTYRTGKQIDLLPGFEVDAGADFEAYIDPFQCDGNGDYVRIANDTGNPRTIYNAPTNYVQYANAGNNNPAVSSSSLTTPSVSSGVSKPKDAKPASEFNITPNPSSGIFTLQLKESAGEVFIYNSLGQVVYKMDNVKWLMANGNTSTINHQPLTIDLSSHPKGIYFIKVQSGGEIYTEKVVLQ